MYVAFAHATPHEMHCDLLVSDLVFHAFGTLTAHPKDVRQDMHVLSYIFRMFTPYT